MKNKVLNYKELVELAKANYTHGGMSIVECWEQSTFDEYVKEFGPITHDGAFEMFGFLHDVDMEENANAKNTI